MLALALAAAALALAAAAVALAAAAFAARACDLSVLGQLSDCGPQRHLPVVHGGMRCGGERGHVHHARRHLLQRVLRC